MIKKMILMTSVLISQAMASESDLEMAIEAGRYMTIKNRPDIIFVDEIHSSLGGDSFRTFGEYDSDTNTIRIAAWNSATYKQIRTDFPEEFARQIFRGKIIHEMDHARAIQAGESDRLNLEISAYRAEVGSWSDKLRAMVASEHPVDDMMDICPTLELMKQNPIGFAIMVSTYDLSPKRCGSPGI